MRTQANLSLLGLAAAVLVNVACGARSASMTPTDGTTPASEALAFETLAHGAAPGGADRAPSLVVIQNDAQRAQHAERLAAPDRAALDALDLSTTVVVAALLGLQLTSGYGIEISAVARHGERLDVTVQRSAPAPGAPTRPGGESPYHLVRIERATFTSNPCTRFRLRDATGDILGEGPLDAPPSATPPPAP